MGRSLAALSAVVLAVLALPLSSATARSAAPAPLAAPPMGWSSRTLGCAVSDAAVRQAADALTPLSQYGYRYVIIESCWQAAQRDGAGNIAADPARFPQGIKALADYVHGKGLKLGLALSAGTKACAGNGPGSYKSESADADAVKSWGIDHLTYDWCNVPMADFPGKDSRAVAELLYRPMRAALGDGVVFAMNNEDGNSVPWFWGKEVAGTWRTNVYNRPIADTYGSMVGLWETNQLRYDHVTKGSWANPDLLQAGRGGMTENEYRTQFTLWATASAPLILQAAPDKAPASVIANPKVIAVNQDPLGAMGKLVKSDGWYHVLAKPLQDGSQAITLFNESERATTISYRLKPEGRYRVENLWTGAVSTTTGAISAAVPARSAIIYRVTPSREKAPPLVTYEIDPAAFLGDNRPSSVEPGKSNEIITRAVNTGGTERLRDVTVTLAVPEGWTARATTPATTRSLAPGETFTVRWALTPPQGAEQKAYDLRGAVTAKDGAGTEGTAVVRVASAPGPGQSYLSDLTYLSAKNHFGPVEKDRSNGNVAAGDGLPITIEGVVYPKGLGAHGPAEIEYYLAGRCSSVEFFAGVDDEVGASAGSVEFEVWADGERTARSGVLTGAQAAKKIVASVEGARYLRLVVTNGGDNATSDHADLADAKITCT
ncbi:NPCBM/NEW2 domain-containing protein [Nonomuraea sp. NBC_01738]|uniref:NPCBM/NEW2 domain-containing protein n=1 Tax=Nonomuraea sp. NBC_01738 TaxID=2976003 RepID=UPI002E16434A|nr:NPCBM/NEW2 domain-containing protein [Nonomuraea sp. NBC_01738]